MRFCLLFCQFYNIFGVIYWADYAMYQEFLSKSLKECMKSFGNDLAVTTQRRMLRLVMPSRRPADVRQSTRVNVFSFLAIFRLTNQTYATGSDSLMSDSGKMLLRKCKGVQYHANFGAIDNMTWTKSSNNTNRQVQTFFQLDQVIIKDARQHTRNAKSKYPNYEIQIVNTHVVSALYLLRAIYTLGNKYHSNRVHSIKFYYYVFLRIN